jgi:hypothetical protein
MFERFNDSFASSPHRARLQNMRGRFATQVSYRHWGNYRREHRRTIGAVDWDTDSRVGLEVRMCPLTDRPRGVFMKGSHELTLQVRWEPRLRRVYNGSEFSTTRPCTHILYPVVRNVGTWARAASSSTPNDSLQLWNGVRRSAGIASRLSEALRISRFAFDFIG